MKNRDKFELISFVLKVDRAGVMILSTSEPSARIVHRPSRPNLTDIKGITNRFLENQSSHLVGWYHQPESKSCFNHYKYQFAGFTHAEQKQEFAIGWWKYKNAATHVGL